MNDDQCNVIIDAIKELTDSIKEVKEAIDDLRYSSYSDSDLRKEVHLIAEVLEDIKDFKL